MQATAQIYVCVCGMTVSSGGGGGDEGREIGKWLNVRTKLTIKQSEQESPYNISHEPSKIALLWEMINCY